MSSIKDRQRAAARARLEREMAERAATARKRRQTLAIVGGGLALLLVAAGTVWLVVALDDGKKPATASAAPGTANCAWNPEQSGGGAKVKDVGTPPTNVPNVGNRVMTIDTNLGPIKAKLDLSKVPCTGASFTYLGSKKFFDNSKCHRLVTEGIKVLQCGDPFATGAGYRDTDGTGGPSYRFAEENLPKDQKPTYPEGVIAMAKTQEPSSTGSQFFIVYADTELDPAYTVLGTITEGLNLVKDVAAAGDDGAFASQAGGGHPKKEVVIKTLTVAAA